MEEVKLWRKNSVGIGTWRVRLIEANATKAVIAVYHTIVEGGQEICHTDTIVTNQSGRTLLQQVDLEMSSRINRQEKKGYKRSREDAIQFGSTNKMGLVNPMLAHPLKRVTLRGSDFDMAHVQPKYDGHRCLITKQDGDMLAYSRQGTPIITIPHILEPLERIMQDGDTFDGELYCHGTKLQTLSSWIKAGQDSSRKLNFHWYDLVGLKVFSDRYRLMRDLADSIPDCQVHLVPTQRVAKMSQVYDHFREQRTFGMEGSMLRLDRGGYADGKRSDQLVKIKEREDGEVLVIGARPSRDGWAILQVEFKVPDKFTSVKFDISAPGSVAEKTEVLRNIDKYINRLLTIEYAMLTDDGVPFHAVATRWQELI